MKKEGVGETKRARLCVCACVCVCETESGGGSVGAEGSWSDTAAKLLEVENN